MTGNPLPPPGSTLQERIAALPENLRGLAQNDYMIDEGMLPDGHMLNDAADRIEDLEAEVERLTARVTELEGDPRMAFTGQHYCDLRAQHAVATSYHAALDAGLAAADKATRQTSRTLPAKKAARAYHKALTKFAKDVGYNPDSVLLMTTNTEIRRFVDRPSYPPSALVIFEVLSVDLEPEGVETEFGPIEFNLPKFDGVTVESVNSYTLAFYAE